MISATATNEPRSLNTRTESPVSIRRGAASSEWMRMVGGLARFSCAGTFAKTELMK
jgi:hypothetical protein